MYETPFPRLTDPSRQCDALRYVQQSQVTLRLTVSQPQVGIFWPLLFVILAGLLIGGFGGGAFGGADGFLLGLPADVDGFAAPLGTLRDADRLIADLDPDRVRMHARQDADSHPGRLGDVDFGGEGLGLPVGFDLLASDEQYPE